MADLESPKIAVALQQLDPTHAELLRALVRDLQAVARLVQQLDTRLQTVETVLGL